jgi:hypothetical protein
MRVFRPLNWLRICTASSGVPSWGGLGSNMGFRGGQPQGLRWSAAGFEVVRRRFGGGQPEGWRWFVGALRVVSRRVGGGSPEL